MSVFAELTRDATKLLDPFAGTGRIFELARPGLCIVGIEIEEEWAGSRNGMACANALSLPFPTGSFDAICTSPTYGNRMADHHNARDASRRVTYRHAIGRPLHPQNSGAMQWGAEYRAFHEKAWMECRRVLRPGGVFVLNIKDHIRGGERQAVTDWHIATILQLGFTHAESRHVPTPGMRFGANANTRIAYESVVKFVR